LRLRSPVPRLGSTSLASNSSLGDWRVAKTTYKIKIQTLRHHDNLNPASALVFALAL
jgi:hypothetical protein